MRSPDLRIGYSLLHIKDRPFALRDVLAAEPDGHEWTDTLASAAYGSGFVALVGPIRSESTVAEDGMGASTSISGMVRVDGSMSPNPSFIYEASDYTEMLISIDPNRNKPTVDDGLVLGVVLREISERAVEHDAPILSLETPVVIPQITYLSDDRPQRQERWRSPSGLGIRFSAALDRGRAGAQIRFADRLLEFCRERGLGLWMGDRRPGHRQGNWFRLIAHEEGRVADFRAQLPPVTERGVTYVVPLSAIGPARIGSTNAIISALVAAGIPILSTSITAMRDLAIIHVLLGGTGDRSVSRFGSMQKDLGVDEAIKMLSDEVGTSSDAPAVRAAERLAERCVDYVSVAGPSLVPRANIVKNRGVIWTSWEVPAGSIGLGATLEALLDSITDCLTRAGDDITASESRAAELRPSIEYLICRRASRDTVKGRCKISVPRDAVQQSADVDARRAPQRFSNGVELAFRERLWKVEAARGGDLSVGWRELWLSRSSFGL
jgi:hypothetical protein